MKWRRTKNPDVIDQRDGDSGGGLGGGMGGLPLPSGAGKGVGGLGIVGIIIFIVIQLLGGGSGGGFNIPGGLPSNVQAQDPQAGEEGIPPGEDPQADIKDFSTYVFTDVQQMWKQTYAGAGQQYGKAQLVLYDGAVRTGCGNATSAVGPFYCPADERVYLDLTFYEQMKQELGAPGDFAWAYVIAHEMGHHIQDLDGTSDKVQAQSQGGDANELSVRLELQADCYAGVWAKTVFAKGDLEQGDIEEAQNAAAAVGDDRLQSRGGGSVNPDSFTHGTSEQRQHWFETGYDSGEPASCDTFSPDSV